MANEKRLIDANKLICAFKRYAKVKPNAAWNAFGLEEIINACPTEDAVEVVHGRWIEDVATDMIACTECGHAWNIIDNCTETFNYCPNCGAKMDGGNEE